METTNYKSQVSVYGALSNEEFSVITDCLKAQEIVKSTDEILLVQDNDTVIVNEELTVALPNASKATQKNSDYVLTTFNKAKKPVLACTFIER